MLIPAHFHFLKKGAVMRVYTGARRKRTATPVSRRQRAVAFRHTKYKAVRVLQDAEETVLTPAETIAELPVPETEPEIPEPVEKPAEEPEIIPEQPAEEPETEETPAEPAVEETPAETAEEPQPAVQEPEPVKETAAERRARRKARKELRKEQDFEDYLSTPRTGILKKLLLPFLALEKEASADQRVTAPFFSLVVNIFKYIAAAAWASGIVAGFINANPFGFTRMIFSDCAWLTVRLAVYMLAAQYVLAAVMGLVSFVLRSTVSWKRLIATMSQSSLFTGVLFTIAALIYGKFPAVGIGLGIAAAVTGFFLTLSAVAKHIDLTKHAGMLILVAVITVLAVFGLKYIQSVCTDVWMILKTIMNV